MRDRPERELISRNKNESTFQGSEMDSNVPWNGWYVFLSKSQNEKQKLPFINLTNFKIKSWNIYKIGLIFIIQKF